MAGNYKRGRRNLFDRIIKIAFSVVFAILIYFVIYMSNRSVRQVSIPLTVVRSESVINSSNIPETVDVQIIGDDGLIFNVNPDKIKACLDFSKLSNPGIYDVPVKLKYDLGIVDALRIEIVCMQPTVRISFDYNDTVYNIL